MMRIDLRLYPMVLVGIVYVVGVLVGNALISFDLLRSLAIAMLALLLSGFIMLRYRHVSGVLLLLSVAVFGMLRITVSHSDSDVVLPVDEVEYDAVVMTEPVAHGKVVQMDLLLVKGDRKLPVRASLLRDTVEYHYERLHVGHGIHAWSILERDDRRGNIRTFIYYNNWLPTVVDLRQLSVMQRARLRLLTIRGRLAGIFSDYSVVRAMVLGDKSGLSRDIRKDYSTSGVSHLLALSGLHLGIIYALLSLVTFRVRRHWLGQLLTLLAIWGYVMLVGMMPSVVRSACMLTVYSVAIVLGRGTMPVNCWALAAVVMLLVDPMSLWDVGFQMSFLAVLAIILITPMILKVPFVAKLRSNIVCRWVVDLLAVSLAAQVGTSPLIACVFGRVATYGILVNLIAVPLAMLVVWVAVICIMVAWSPVMLSLLRNVIGWLSDVLNSVVGFVASLPCASVEINFSLAQTISCYILLTSLLMICSLLGFRGGK